MKSEASEFIRYLANFAVFIPFLFYLLKFRVLPKENHIIGALVIVSGFANVVTFFYASMKINNAYILNMYVIIAFSILCWYYYQVLFQFKNARYFYFGIGVYLISFVWITSDIGIFVFQGEMWAISGLILFAFGILYNNYQVEKPPLLDKNLYSGLVFNAAIMFYFSFNFFLFIIADYTLTELSPANSRMVWAFHNLNSILKDIAIGVGLYYTNRRKLDFSEEEMERIEWRHLQ